MLNFFTTSSQSKKAALPITPIVTAEFSKWLEKQNARVKNWLKANNFSAKSGSSCLLPDGNGKITEVFLGLENADDIWAFGNLPTALCQGTWYINASKWPAAKIQKCAIAWGLGNYQFTQYKKPSRKLTAQLFLPKTCDYKHIENVVNAIFLARDLINQPAETLGPAELAKVVVDIAKHHKAKITQVVGENLLRQNYPLVHLVGRSSNRAPRLVEFTWGKINHPKLTIIGKGICFDSGGLDLKPPAYMDKMKKDMAGVAHALGLAKMIMTAKLPVHLHVILPMAENLVSAPAMKPGDIVKARNGKTVEINNTDAEGRLLLADSLTRASEKKPDVIIDIATLTGAAAVALGTEIIAMFANDDKLADAINKAFIKEQDFSIWRMPLYKPYRELLNSKIADISNLASGGYGGAITAALFLQEFVSNKIPWLHLDLMGSNVKSKPGRPEGGEAMGLQGLFAYVCDYFCRS